MDSRYLTIALELEDEFLALGPNRLLPTEHQYAKRFGVSRLTVSRALGLLEHSGIISRQRGRGTIVSPPKITRTFSPLLTFEEDLKLQGIKFETALIEYKTITAPQSIGQKLQLPPETPVARLSLVRLVEDQVICHDHRHLPPRVAALFNPPDAQNRPIIEILGELVGMPVQKIDWEWEIVPASREVAEPLGIRPRTLIAAYTFTWYLADGSPIDVGVTSYRIDRCKFRFSGKRTTSARAT